MSDRTGQFSFNHILLYQQEQRVRHIMLMTVAGPSSVDNETFLNLKLKQI
jgi:hypothetical protein